MKSLPGLLFNLIKDKIPAKMDTDNKRMGIFPTKPPLKTYILPPKKKK